MKLVLVLAAALAASLAVAPPARAGGQVVRDLGERARVDWSQGILSATAGSPADLAAPSVAVARVGAERRARVAARARLTALVADLPVAAGGTVGDRSRSDAAVAARVAAAVAAAGDVAVDYGSDGTTVVTLGVALDGLRAALDGAATGLAPADAPSAIVVIAGKHLGAPALGLGLEVAGERHAGPTVYVRGKAAVAAEARLGDRVVEVRATGHHDASLVVDGITAEQLAAARAADALVVVVLGGGT